MVTHNKITRRAVLGAVGTGIATTGVVSGQSSPPQGRRTTSENGIVIQYEDCETVHVRGRGHNVDAIELHGLFWTYIGPDLTPYDGITGIFDPNLPVTLNATEMFPRAETNAIAITVYVQQYEPEYEELAVMGHPSDWNCPDALEDPE